VAEQNYWNNLWGKRASRRSMLRAGGVAGIGITGAALIGCGDDDDPDPTATQPPAGTQAPGGTSTPGPAPTQAPPSGEPQQGGHLRLGITNIPQENFNTVTNTTEGNYLSAQHVYDYLLSPRVGLEHEDSLLAAESVEIVDDLTFRFTLKDGLVYQDLPPANGRAVRAEDIAAMQEYVRDSETAIDRSFQTAILDNVETPDDRTVIYHLQRPYAYFFSGAALGYAHNNVITPAELTISGEYGDVPPVGSGPYQIADYQFGVQYDYERNPTFRDADRGLPYIDRVTRLILGDSTALETAFRGEQMTVHYAPQPEIADRLIEDLGDQLTVVEFLTLTPVQATMSSHREWTQDIRNREAVFRLYDLQEYVDLILDGRGVPNTNLVQQGLTPYLLDESEVAPYRRHDAADARALFEATGFDFDAERELTTIQGGGAGRNEIALQILQEQLRRVGIPNVTYKVAQVGDFLTNISGTGQFDFGIWANQASDVPQRMLRLNHTTTLTPHDSTNIRDPEVDALIEASEQEVDFEAHVNIVKDLQRTLLEKYAHTQLVWAAQERQLHWAYLHDFEAARQTVAMQNTEAWMDV
jgi:peptide/nickel transport system substrate-binding protein